MANLTLGLLGPLQVIRFIPLCHPGNGVVAAARRVDLADDAGPQRDLPAARRHLTRQLEVDP